MYGWLDGWVGLGCTHAHAAASDLDRGREHRLGRRGVDVPGSDGAGLLKGRGEGVYEVGSGELGDSQ